MGHEEEQEDIAPLSLGLPPENLFRAMCIRIANHNVFEAFMTLCIVLSCAFMTLERPLLDEQSITFKILHWSNITLSAAFAFECVVKVVSYSPQEYWAKHSNKIDTVIVFVSFLLMILEDSDLAALKSLRVLRALKAMRVATRSDAMRHQVSLIFSSLLSMVCSC